MKKLLSLLLTGVIMTACLASGCGGEVKAYSDPQQMIAIGTSGEFVILIALDSNPTTGYSWEASYDETLLELVEETFEADAYAGENIVGAGGAELFRFKALKKGDVEITMSYKRSWETEVLEQKVFSVEVK